LGLALPELDTSALCNQHSLFIRMKLQQDAKVKTTKN